MIIRQVVYTFRVFLSLLYSYFLKNNYFITGFVKFKSSFTTELFRFLELFGFVLYVFLGVYVYIVSVRPLSVSLWNCRRFLFTDQCIVFVVMTITNWIVFFTSMTLL